MDVYKVTAFAVHTTTVLFEILALFCFVFVVQLIVLEQLVRPVCEFATHLVGTKTELHVAPTQLRLFFRVFRINGDFYFGERG